MRQTGTTLRHVWLDGLRGFAILLMIPANLAPILAETHPLWFRIAGSYAAPIFVMLSAGMVILGSSHHTLSYYLKRGLSVIAVGVLIDTFLWRILPFTSFDVLYTIGLGLPLIFLLRNLRTRIIFVIGAAIFLSAFLLQYTFGYTEVPYQIYFDEFSMPTLERLARSWFIDGWFPILPWIGYAMVGAVLFRAIFDHAKLVTMNRLAIVGALLTAAGFALLFLPVPGLINLANGTIIGTREGYSEIFYPASFPYILSSFGVVVLAIALFSKFQRLHVVRALGFFGRYSMLVYILHQMLEELVLKPVIHSAGAESITNGWVFALANVAVFLVIAILCALTTYMKHKFPPKNVFLQVLFGR